METGFEYFEHDADIGIAGRGTSVEQAFEQAALAMFAVMANLRTLNDDQHLEIQFEESNLELALAEMLNRLLAESRRNGMALKRCSVQRSGSHWHVECWGQTWHSGIERGTEVKGATLTMLSVAPLNDGWAARCVIDV